MHLLAAAFVGNPLVIALVALAFCAAGFLKRRKPGGNPRPLFIAAAAWALYAAWEWLVLVRTPEANIRVDLLLIWPIVALLSIWALYRAWRRN
jgi:hypothetical protein